MTNYHQLTPDPDVLSNRMLTYETAPVMVNATATTGPTDAAVHAPVVELPTTLDGLIALRDRLFVDAAYRVILGREPDPEGFAYYLGRLRGGTLGKVDIVGDLRYSGEGRQHPVNLGGGLRVRYALRRIARLPVLGWLCRWLIAAAELPKLLQAVRGQYALMEQISVVAEAQAMAQRARDAEQRTRDADTRVLVTRLGMVESAWREWRGRGRVLLKRLDSTESSVRELSSRSEAHAARLAAAELAFEERHQRLSAANARLTQQLRVVTTTQAVPAAESTGMVRPASDRSILPADFDTFYVEFEDRFRGAREDIKRAQEVYLDYVTASGAGTESAPIVDLGCGRGEWLQLLQEHGFVARGIELNHVMILENKQRGLDVIEHDALTYLADLPDASVRMVTGFHIIEHLRFDLLVRLFDECRRVLQPGGCVVFETPNPENLVVGAYTFYFDPTHRHPLPPLTIEFLAQHRGFADVEILRLHPRPEHGADAALLDKWFRVALDYAVIGWKNGKAHR